ncbi:MAG: hypothetical protein KDC18_05700 [Alphaproteobacteria bacterium]|nr:hypothetical protein [Alphaproteobacteria bacterium]MCB9931020.1 hypothetical protein [Alphaproteobacteria bacterium]
MATTMVFDRRAKAVGPAALSGIAVHIPVSHNRPGPEVRLRADFGFGPLAVILIEF